MGLEDFAYEFKNLYVCRLFQTSAWHTEEIYGEWKGSSSAGLPTKSSPGADMSLNPHYAISVPRRSTAFITLTQMDRKDTFRGVHKILFLVQKNNG
mmetsp:Transcript_14868/g.12660  ORF Transcript_14868/g.12660 Transcript_14868/m.12660 type:complete len:96 (-) Transcript_14868:169-456(-)